MNKLINVNDYLDECQNWGLPQLLHKGACTQTNQADEKEKCQVCKYFHNKIMLLVIWMVRARNLEKQETTCTKLLEKLIDKLELK